MKEKLTIVKVGGAVVEDELQLSQLLRDFSAIEGRKVLVHGGGRKATKMAERLGIETRTSHHGYRHAGGRDDGLWRTGE